MDGLFVLGVKIENITQEINELKRLEEAADVVAKKLRSLGAAKGTAARLGFTKGLEKEINKLIPGISKIEGALSSVNSKFGMPGKQK